jgi:hypothetical protein
MQDCFDINTLWDEVKTDTMQRLEAIAETLEGKIAQRVSNYSPGAIYHTGEFLNKLTHSVVDDGSDFIVQIWSDAPHSRYVLGGKVPSWTPIKPLISWVEKKNLSWVDKSGKRLTAIQMAYMIRNKIKRDGITERNVFREVLEDELSWIEQQLHYRGD